MEDRLEQEESLPIWDLLSLQSMKEECNSLGEKQFLKKHPNPFLVILSAPADANGAIQHQTVDTKTLMEKSTIKISTHAVALVKRSRNPYQQKITIGRATNNDIIIRSSRISKVHAYLSFVEQGYQLSDAGSRNGTFVNTERLGEKQKVMLLEGDVISFSKFQFLFLSSEGLLKVLKSGLNG